MTEASFSFVPAIKRSTLSKCRANNSRARRGRGIMWYYADNGRQVGPVDESALDGLVQQGLIRDSTLVWREGMAAWQPLSAARPRPVAQAVASAPSAAAAPAPAAAPQSSETRYCAECGRAYQ